MSSTDSQIREQAVWALGNIAGDSPNCRDYVLQFNIIDQLLLMTREGARPSLQRNATWTISNLCRGKPAPPFHTVSVCLKDLARLLYSPDEQVIIDACWALSYLSDGDNVRIQAVMEAEVGLRVVELLMHSSPAVQTPALRVVGNIVTGDDLQTQCIINFQALPRLRTLLLTTQKKGIRKEVCWTISNITAGTPAQIKAVIDADLIGPLIMQLSEADFDIKKEAAWAIANATSSGTAEQVKYVLVHLILSLISHLISNSLVNVLFSLYDRHLVMDHACIPAMCELLTAPDARIVAVALEGLENILEYGARELTPHGENPYALIINECNGIDRIEALQDHPNPTLYDKAYNIIDKYFQGTDSAPVGAIAADATSFARPTTGGPDGGYSW